MVGIECKSTWPMHLQRMEASKWQRHLINVWSIIFTNEKLSIPVMMANVLAAFFSLFDSIDSLTCFLCFVNAFDWIRSCWYGVDEDEGLLLEQILVSVVSLSEITDNLLIPELLRWHNSFDSAMFVTICSSLLSVWSVGLSPNLSVGLSPNLSADGLSPNSSVDGLSPNIFGVLPLDNGTTNLPGFLLILFLATWKINQWKLIN